MGLLAGRPTTALPCEPRVRKRLGMVGTASGQQVIIELMGDVLT